MVLHNHPHDLSRSPSPYDFDVAVIGAGPAGMTAAIRTRWVKSYKSVPCSTVLFDGAGLGGLAKWRSSMLTGPSFHLNARELVGRLKGDIEQLEVPLVRSKVVSITWERTVKKITVQSGQCFNVLAVIIATGFRSLSNEENYSKDIAITYMGYEFFEELFSRLFAPDGRKTVLIVGNEFTRNIVELIESSNQGRHDIVYLMQSKKDEISLNNTHGTVLHGKIIQCEGSSKLEGVRVLLNGVEEKFIACQRVLLDYNAFELCPCFEFDTGPLEKDERGFIKVDRHMRTNNPAVYAAGDVTGLYATVARSISDGIVAGFSAYRDIFKLKFNSDPYLFAYRATDMAIGPGFKDLPQLQMHHRPKLLVSADKVSACLEEYCRKSKRSPDGLQELLQECRGGRTLEDLSKLTRIDQNQLTGFMEFMLEKKAIAIHI